MLKAPQFKIAGATVLRGIMGYGGSSRAHSAKVLMLSEDLPVVVEIVDTADKLNEIMPFLDEVVAEGLVTMELVNVVKYRHRSLTQE